MNANKIMYRYRYGIVTRIVDGDGIFIADLEKGNEFEIRLLGIDAPEISQCKKLIQDERETHLPGDLLRQLGLLSKSHLANLLPIGTKVLYRCADKNNIDLYRRLLAFVYLADGRCINEILLINGYAKPLDKYECDQISFYKALNTTARVEKCGLYNLVSHF